MKKLGLIVNPIAGMGGAVGLKGTDGAGLLDRAKELGAVPRAEQRATIALETISRACKGATVVTYAGAMGENVSALSGLRPEIVGEARTDPSTALDTREATERITGAGIDLLLFAGGDGTARDVCDAVGTSCTCLGIPAGVKIQSEVFATSPAVAGQVAASFLTGRLARTKKGEVLDINEHDYRREVLSSRLYGYLQVPDASHLIQNRKAASAPSESFAQRAIASEIVKQMTDDLCYVFGPGTTCSTLMETLGLEGTLLGVDVVRAGSVVGSDLSEREILEAAGESECRLILTPVGGQGFLLGRGNQQITPKVLRRVGKVILDDAATAEKLSSLRGRPLLVDTGDADTDEWLSGYYRVVTGYREVTVYRVAAT